MSSVTDSRLCVNLSQLYQDVDVVDAMLETIQDTVLRFQVRCLGHRALDACCG